MGIEQSAIRRHSATPMGLVAVKCLKSLRWWHFRCAHKSYSHFPLTCEGSIPTFYAFSGVETAGEQEAQESCFPVRALTGSKLAAQSNL
jgi:hypothetical protein